MEDIYREKADRNIVAALRAAIVVVTIALQILLLLAISVWLPEFGVAITVAIDIASICVLLRLISSREDSSYKIAWLLIVTLMPIFGLLLYLLWGWAPLGMRSRKQIRRAFGRANDELPKNNEVTEKIALAHPKFAGVSAYLANCGFPAYVGTNMRYLPQGEDYFDALCRDMEGATRFIFLEFFIVDYGQVFDRIVDILERKAREGLDVRLLYDDAGCLFTLKRGFAAQMAQKGIRAKAFGNVHRYVSELHINYRNHRKVAVIDGDIGYTGGINLADEYANLFEKHGHWMDTGIRIDGEGTWTLTATFLAMWDLAHRGAETDDYTLYTPAGDRQKSGQAGDFCQIVADGPANNPKNPIQDMYRMVIGSARQYCYITTPYLVLDTGMSDALRLAAQSGVDVRIYVPGMPDHWYVHPVTRSFYGLLLCEGVRIYEYAPGFLHAKMMIADDEAAVIGTVNLDFRSFYLHYEDAVLATGGDIAVAVRDDLLAMQEQCREITLADWKNRPIVEKLSGYVLRLFSTLM